MVKVFQIKTALLIIAVIMIFIMNFSYSLEVTKLNFEKDIYPLIPSQDYLFMDYKITPDKKLVIFYKDKEEKNLNKNFILIMDIPKKKVEKILSVDYTRYKESVVDKDGNIYILSWKPVDIYFLDIKNYKISKVYDNGLPEKDQEKYIFTLDSNFIKSSNDEIFVVIDLKKEKLISEDVVISKINYENNTLKIEPYFSSYKISSFFKNKPYIMLLNYPQNIFVNLIKEKELYQIDTNQGYNKEIDLSLTTKKIADNISSIFSIKEDYILAFMEKQKKLSIIDSKNLSNTIEINVPKPLDAQFLSHNKIVFNSIQGKKITFHIFDISKKEIKNLGEIEGVRISVLNSQTFYTFNKKDIFIVNVP